MVEFRTLGRLDLRGPNGNLNVVSNARVDEIRGQLRERANAEGLVAQAAKRAGATDLVEGAVYRRQSGILRLDVRLISLRAGTLTAAFTIEGEDLFTLVDRATAELAKEMTAHAAPESIASMTTRSLAERETKAAL